ncbi:hypothetical protein [Indiicoccus explosivorum]|uniref:hypothetical protein n=1 Tax=Indiicoccus explosivorum TaxID=1917864 RepID=UPI00139053CC|nr:hypothetical protein [Indiicoccus explosivorum]
MSIALVDFKPLVELIIHTNTLHHKHSRQWLNDLQDVYNLKRSQVKNICLSSTDSEEDNKVTLDTHFLQYMNSYCEGLIPVLYEPAYDFFGLDFDISIRIKDPDSRVAKLMHYMKDKEEKGAMSIKKCLNDLFGLRVWIDGFDHSEAAIDHIKNLVQIEPFRIYNASKGEYKATHAYFSNGNNKYFPWELQIWNPEDTQSNICSHSIHKQGYTKWVEDYKQMPLIEEVKKDV